MRMNAACHRMLAAVLVVFMAVPPWVLAQSNEAPTKLRQEELDQILAPIALYPDPLIAQIFMASTYPLEVVMADRWVKQNPQLKGDALAAALEKQTWDASVKSLVNFPQVLDMMSEKLDWTTKLGDAFLAQQADLMDTVQKLRSKANAEGNLKTNSEQKVIVEQQIIRIEPANPQVIYVPTYNPTIVYGTWWYPAYPPYYYYPPGYIAGAALFTFGAGVALGAAWGYAWGGCRWGHHHGHVDININRNVNFNRNINRNYYRNEMTRRGQIGASGSGRWQHNAEHRKGVAYRDRATARQFNRSDSLDRTRARENYRGRAESGRRELSRGAADQFRNRGQRVQSGMPQRRDRPTTAGPGRTDRGRDARMQSGTSERRSQATTRSQRGNAFEGVDRGRAASTYSNRGRSSRSSMSGGRSGGRSGGFSGRGGGSRGGGGRR